MSMISYIYFYRSNAFTIIIILRLILLKVIKVVIFIQFLTNQKCVYIKLVRGLRDPNSQHGDPMLIAMAVPTYI